MLIVPRKRIWTQQPQGSVSIDWSNPTARIIGSAMCPGLGTYDAVSGVTQSGSGYSIAVGSEGKAWFVDTNGKLSTDFDFGKVGTGDFLVACIAQPISNIGPVKVVGVSSQYAGLSQYNGYWQWSNNSVWLSSGIPATSTTGVASVMYFRRGGQGYFCINGIIISAGADNVNYSSFGKGVLFCTNGSASTQGFVGNVYGFVGAYRSPTDVEAKTLSENPWQIFRAPDSRIFVPTGAGAGGGDNLTASSIIASPATVGSPLLSQQHALTASSIASAPAVVASPAITQRHALSSTAASASPAVVGSPSITQRHALSATSISTAPAVVAAPTLTEIVAGILSALPVIAAPAVVGTPAITQRHALSAGAISAGPATFGTPTIAQQHALMAQGVTASPAAVGAPALSEGGAAPFTAEQFLYLEANYVTIANINDIAAAVLAALQATAIPVNVKQVNDLTVVGQGMAPPNHWRPE